MSYYQGDYYQGDYYQGDPFLGSLIGMGATWLGKKLLGKGAAKAGASVVAGTGLGGLVGGATGVATGIATTFLPGIARNIWNRGSLQGPPIPGGQGAPINLTLQGGAMGPGGCPACPTGYHWNKSRSMARATMGAAPGTVCVRNRAMNVANPRALRRSLRRVTGFAKLASRSRTSIKKAARMV